MKKYFEFEDEKSSKFWQIEVEDESFTVTFGKIGTDGQTQTKDFDTEEQCLKEAQKLIDEKLKKGYVDKTTEDEDEDEDDYEDYDSGENQVEHKFWGMVEQDWAGFSGEVKFTSPHFEQEVDIFLGTEFDEEGDEIENPPEPEQLDEYETVYKSFVAQFDKIIIEIQEKAFKQYVKQYAKYYEKPFKVESFFDTDVSEGKKHDPLGIDSKEKHFEYMKDIEYLRITDGKTIYMPIHYKLDTEHGLEIKFVNNKIADIAGIAET